MYQPWNINDGWHNLGIRSLSIADGAVCVKETAFIVGHKPGDRYAALDLVLAKVFSKTVGIGPSV